jgi:hypothetical protein
VPIVTPNTHPIWDPDWAAGKLEKTHAEQIALGSELVRYGADLLLRALKSAPDDIPNHVLLAVLFRQAIAAFDGAIIGLKAAALGAAHMHARAQMEARWGLMLALQDPAKWGRHIYVASRREQRASAARLVPGTPEYDANAPSRAMIEAGGGTTAKPELADLVKSIDRILDKSENKEVDCTFSEFEAKNKRPAPWFYDATAPSSKRITSFGRLAAAVGCRGEYDTLYRHASYYVHGSFTGTSLKYDEKAVAIAPIRSPEGWRQLYIFSVSLATDSYRRVIDQYRSGEVSTFVKKYVERWRKLIQDTPDVEVIINRIVNE